MAFWSRRDYLTLSLSAAALAACSRSETSAPAEPAEPAGTEDAGSEPTPLSVLAAEKGMRFGTAMSAWVLNDEQYLDIVRRECSTIVPENECKMYVIHNEPDQWNFEPADRLVAFAKGNDMTMRGHTLLWHREQYTPQWVNDLEFSSAAEAEKMLDDYIKRVATHFSPFLYSWDVVNEAIDPQTGELRSTSFSRAMGPEVIDFCFHKAREYAPNATLAYNDYMSWEPSHDKHRAGVMNLLDRLVANNVPIDALGIQSHSNDAPPQAFDTTQQGLWGEFCDSAVGMGLELYLTEFDIDDSRMSPDPDERDAVMASFTKDYLDMMFSYEETKELLAWGMIDKYSWLQNFNRREDGIAKRPTLYDADYQPKPMRHAIAEALKDAAPRSPGKANPTTGDD